MESEILTLTEAARLLGRSEGSLRSNADRGIIPCMRSANGRRIFRRKDLERFIEKHRGQSEGGPRPAA